MAAADFIPYLYRFLKERQPEALWEGDRSQAHIALTFDDGPHPTYTPPLLKVLAQYKVKATFFWLGSWVERYPEVARAVYEQGHWIGLHSYKHRAFIGQSLPSIRSDLEKTQQAIAQTCHSSPTQFIDVRPPYGICSRKIIQSLRQWGYRPVMWSVVPIDWTEPGINIVTKRIRTNTTGGDIIVLHDGSSGGPAVADTTAQILPVLQQTGFTFITIDNMWSQGSAVRDNINNN